MCRDGRDRVIVTQLWTTLIRSFLTSKAETRSAIAVEMTTLQLAARSDRSRNNLMNLATVGLRKGVLAASATSG